LDWGAKITIIIMMWEIESERASTGESRERALGSGADSRNTFGQNRDLVEEEEEEEANKN
jgi:hypothetical protein